MLHKQLGAVPMPDESTHFTLWAPTQRDVALVLVGSGRTLPMAKLDGGYHCITVDSVRHGDRYQYRLSDGTTLPDPASRSQPDGVHGPSEVIDPRFDWSDQAWTGIPREQLIIYELHIGAFTSEGTFAAASDRLPELVDLGITAIELMPVAASAGDRNWGYDGVAWFAPLAAYGTPEDLRRLVDRAHAVGLAVILDVVYNHLGPEGNYLDAMGGYLSDRHSTPWGAAPDFDSPGHGPQVRRFAIANALHWVDEYHFDGLRVDAIHCLYDDSPIHVADELSGVIRQWSRQSGRSVTLIAESNVYDPHLVRPADEGGPGYDAEWSDDFLHSMFAMFRPDEQLCQREYLQGSDLETTLRFGFVYEGTVRTPRQRKPQGPAADPRGLVYSIQNHDFIGNHPLGKRFHQLTSVEAQKAAAALLILSPAIPMLFMGEEFACENPFSFFVDFSDAELCRAVTAGRRAEYPQHDWTGGESPLAESAFTTSKIGDRESGDLGMLNWYRELIGFRRRLVDQQILRPETLSVNSDANHGCFVLRYRSAGGDVSLVVSLFGHDASGICDPDIANQTPTLSSYAKDDGTRMDRTTPFAEVYLR